jgi:hypothetical protein
VFSTCVRWDYNQNTYFLSYAIWCWHLHLVGWWPVLMFWWKLSHSASWGTCFLLCVIFLPCFIVFRGPDPRSILQFLASLFLPFFCSVCGPRFWCSVVCLFLRHILFHIYMQVMDSCISFLGLIFASKLLSVMQSDIHIPFFPDSADFIWCPSDVF